MRAGKIAILLAGLALILAGVATALRMPVAGVLVRGAMKNAGLEKPRARVTALSFDRIALAGISAGPRGAETLEIEAADATFNWRDLLFRRRFEAVRIGPGRITAKLPASAAFDWRDLISRRPVDAVRTEPARSAARVADEGRSEAPVDGAGEGASPRAAPFSVIDVEALALTIETPAGAAGGALSGHYAQQDGGVAELSMETARAGLAEWRAENAEFKATLSLDPDGAARYDVSYAGDIITDANTLKDVHLQIDGTGRSWRKGWRGFAGEARIDLKSATAVIENAPVISDLNPTQAELLFGAPVSLLTASGRAALAFDRDGFALSFAGAPLTLRADSGATLRIEPHGEDVAFRRSKEGSEVNFAFSVRGGGVSFLGLVNAEARERAWSVVAPLQIGAYRSGDVSLEETSAIIRADARGGEFHAYITTSTILRAVSIGRLTIRNAPFSSNLLIDVDAAAKRATVTLPPDHCVTLERGDFFLAQQDMDAALDAARLCQSQTHLAQIDWAGDARVDFAGALNAQSGNYRIGRTRFAGRPPAIDFSGTYQPGKNRTDMRGAVSGGAVKFNEWLIFKNAEGAFELILDPERLKIEGDVERVRVAQPEAAPGLAPVIATGRAHLEGGDAEFHYTLHTPSGARLGEGDGVHNVASAKGDSTFRFDDIVFEKGGLQPNELAPALKGVVAQAVGAADGEVAFRWDPQGGVRSSAKAQLENFDFAGPTRIVTRTFGLNADLAFATLWPASTDGPQTVVVEGIDFGALQLARGEVVFDLPGDETLRVGRAAFPWFGGVLGVYDANASLADGEATAPIRAEHIDLGQILEFVDVKGLSGEGVLSGVLPLVVEDSRARIENGVLRAEGPGALRYVGAAPANAEQTGEQGRIAFELLRDLRYESLHIDVNGPLDGRVKFEIQFEGTGEMTAAGQRVRVPVNYNINLEAALLDLMKQANLSRDIQLQIERAVQGDE